LTELKQTKRLVGKHMDKSPATRKIDHILDEPSGLLLTIQDGVTQKLTQSRIRLRCRNTSSGWSHQQTQGSPYCIAEGHGAAWFSPAGHYISCYNGQNCLMPTCFAPLCVHLNLMKMSASGLRGGREGSRVWLVHGVHWYSGRWV